MAVLSTDEEIRDRAIRSGVKSLREFGWPGVTADNLLTDYVYANAFRSQVKEARDFAEARRHVQYVRVMDAMLAEIDKAKAPEAKPGKPPRRKASKK